ncbi:hypothetical protein ACSBR2_022675 [Camellia fascicularis]
MSTGNKEIRKWKQRKEKEETGPDPNDAPRWVVEDWQYVHARSYLDDFSQRLWRPSGYQTLTPRVVEEGRAKSGRKSLVSGMKRMIFAMYSWIINY